MSDLVHGTFTIERSYPVAAAKVFAAWRDPALKARWFAGPGGWEETERTTDFRVGGREVVAGRFPDGNGSRFECTYHAIVPDAHVVYAYDMHAGGVFLSVSLTTVDLVFDGTVTRMRVTEQGVFFRGEADLENRKQGSAWLMDRLGASIT